MAYEEIHSIAWFSMIQNNKEPVTVILTTHLYVEYALNHLIEFSCKKASTILNDKNRWTFSMKLELCYQMGLIEEYLYTNISKLNKIRNAYSHRLTVNFRDMDLDFFDPKNRVVLSNWKKKGIMDHVPNNNDIVDAVIWIGALTFEPLHNKIVGRDQLNIKPG